MTFRFKIKALEVSQAIDYRSVLLGLGKHYPVVWSDPIMLALSQKRGQYLILTRYGVIALTNISPQLEKRVLTLIQPFLKKPFENVTNEDEIKVVVDPNQEIRVFFDKVSLPSCDVKFLLIISMLLCQSVGLESYEKRVEPLLGQLTNEITNLSKRRIFPRTASLTKNINQIMLLQQELVANLGVLDKPELTWERADLEFLYHRLADNLELLDRAKILSEKFNLLQNNIKNAFDIVSTNRMAGLEFTIVILIVLEIILFLFGIG